MREYKNSQMKAIISLTSIVFIKGDKATYFRCEGRMQGGDKEGVLNIFDWAMPELYDYLVNEYCSGKSPVTIPKQDATKSVAENQATLAAFVRANNVLPEGTTEPIFGRLFTKNTESTLGKRLQASDGSDRSTITFVAVGSYNVINGVVDSEPTEARQHPRKILSQLVKSGEENGFWKVIDIDEIDEEVFNEIEEGHNKLSEKYNHRESEQDWSQIDGRDDYVESDDLYEDWVGRNTFDPDATRYGLRNDFTIDVLDGFPDAYWNID